MTGRNLVVCLDGTSNEPESGATNVTRIFDIAAKNDRQLVYYDPGVGTMASRAAMTRFGQVLSRAAGLVAGSGVKDNLEEAYIWLSQRYQKGDRIYVFGFSRGAYTARALTGMLRAVGLLRPGAENLAPYAVKLYAKNRGRPQPDNPDDAAKADERRYWRLLSEFQRQFGNPDFPHRFAPQVRFLGVWDTVKSVGWLNLKGRIEMATWPFTANISNVEIARHALALDERRRPFKPNRFGFDAVAKSKGRYGEMWFTGVHSDVGGYFPDDHGLSDIALAWMVEEACRDDDFIVDPGRYQTQLGVAFGEKLPDENALGRIHHNEKVWRLAGGWSPRRIREGDPIHPSVRYRVEHTKNDKNPYRPELNH